MLSRCGEMVMVNKQTKITFFEVLLLSKILINECAALLSETLTLMLF